MSSIDWITAENIKELGGVIDELKTVHKELKLLAERRRWNSDDERFQRVTKRQQELLAKWKEIQERAK